MKNFKTILFMSLAFNLSALQAQTTKDPVVDQINITQDAVKTAMEEFTQGKLDVPTSVDAQIKAQAFNQQAQVALVRFEKEVRTQILQSFSSLVSQYNSIYKNKNLGDAKPEILKSMLDQLQSLATDKSYVYRSAYMRLYSVLPELPIAGDLTYYSSGKSDVIYFSKSGPREVMAKASAGNNLKNGILLTDYSIINGIMTKDQPKLALLEGCYTSTCYFSTLTQFIVWKSMVESVLARNLTIKLEDGTSIMITKNVYKYWGFVDMLSEALKGISTDGLIGNLPDDISSERVEILTGMNKELANNSCRNAKRLSNTLSQATREGELMSSELALFTARYGKTASCL
jgi:hypothetical protein